jgi:hypothetical protein
VAGKANLLLTAVNLDWLLLQFGPLQCEEARAHMLLMSTACLIGFFFGLQYKFLVLIPLTLVAALAYGVTGGLHEQTASTIAYAVVVIAFSLQAGYMIGLTSRDFLGQFVSRLIIIPSKRG